ncbi:MAG TPA: glycosyltransferase [Patescibacteria group bacterium]|nr:glycosyltransferase [Patescibacteria group bacterium]
MSRFPSLRERFDHFRTLDIWKTNQFLAATIHPLGKYSLKGVRFGHRVVNSLRPHRIAQRRTVKRLVNYFDKDNRAMRLAKKAVKQRQWPLALSAYKEVLGRKSSKPIKLEFRNEAKFNISVIKRLLKLNNYKKQIANYNDPHKKRKIAVYTAVSGGYDVLKLPERLNPNIDYILFTDIPTSGSGIYKIKPLPYFDSDRVRRARFVKTHPHQLLPEYDIAIWIDANILITGNIEPLIERFLSSGKAIAAVPHPLRKSVFEEVEACLKYGKDGQYDIGRHAEHLKQVHYDCSDLIESNIMMFDLNNKKLADFFATWWSEIDAYSRRDQLSLNYSLDKNNIEWHRLMERPQDARNHPDFALVPHQSEYKSALVLEQALEGEKVDPSESQPFTTIKRRVIAAERNRKIDIIYCVHDALEDVKKCLISVAKYKKNSNLKLIIVDDGSNKSTAKYLKDFAGSHRSWTSLLRNQTAVGYTKAANIGLRSSQAEMVILLNSDTIVTDGWTEKMSDALFKIKGVGIVGPLSSAASHQSIPSSQSTQNQTAINTLPDGLTPDDMNSYCEAWATSSPAIRVPLVHGFCFGIKRDLIDKIGLFNEENFPNGYGEENDYCFRATEAGFGLVIATNTYIFHAKSKSYKDKRRIALMKEGNAKIGLTYGKDRVRRSIITVQTHPVLQELRKKAAEIFAEHL